VVFILARVQVQGVFKCVTRIGPAHLDIDVFVAVIVEVGKRYAMAFL